MSAAPASPPPQPGTNVGVPQWLFAIFVTAVMGAVGAGAVAMMTVRDSVRDHDLRLASLEKAQPALLTVGTQLGALTEKIGALKDTVDEIRKDQRAERRAPPQQR